MNTNCFYKLIVSLIFFSFGSALIAFDQDLLVTKIKDGLYAAEVKTANGQLYYVGMEEMSTPQAYRFWQSYYQATNTTGKEILGSFAQNSFPRNSQISGQINAKISTQLSQNLDHFDAYNPRNSRVDPYRKMEGQIGAGLIGFKEFLRAANDEQKVAYMVYAQREPVTDFAHETFKPVNRLGAPREYNDQHIQHLHQYKNLLLSFGVLTDPQSLSVTHMGIFKNPCIFTNKFSNISVTLHGFAAYCMKNLIDPSKMWQINRPAKAMVNLLLKEFPEGILAKYPTPEHAQLSLLDHCPVVDENPILQIELSILQTAFIKNSLH